MNFLTLEEAAEFVRETLDQQTDNETTIYTLAECIMRAQETRL